MLHEIKFFDKPRLGGVVGSRRVILLLFFQRASGAPLNPPLLLHDFDPEPKFLNLELGHISCLKLINAEFYRWNSKSFLQIR